MLNYFIFEIVFNYIKNRLSVQRYTLSLIMCVFIISYNLSYSQNIDSLILALKNVKNDTVRCKILSQLSENADEGEWQKYNQQLKSLSEQKLKGSLTSSQTKFYKKYLADALNNVGYNEGNAGHFDSALVHYQQSFKIREEINDLEGIAISLNNIGFVYTNTGDPKMALNYFKRSLKIQEQIGDKNTMSSTLTNIGSIYDGEGDIPKALEYYHQGLKIREQLKDKDGIANSLNNIGLLLKNQGELDKALSYFEKSLALRKEIHDAFGIAIMVNNLADIYDMKGDTAKAFSYYKQSLKLEKELDYKLGIAGGLNNIGFLLQNQKQYDSALEYYNKAYAIFEEIGNKKGITFTLNNIGNIYYLKGDYTSAQKNGEKSLEISRQIGNVESIKTAAKLLWGVYKHQNKFKEALQMNELFMLMRDSVNNLQLKKMSIQKQFQYEYDKKVTADSVKISEEKKLVAVQLKHEKIQRFVLYAGLGLAVIFALFILNRFQVTKKQKKLIEIKEVETQYQKQLVEVKQKEILDSIAYAKRLQNAILPPQEYINENLPDNFVFYKPKDIVAGDFYWMELVDGIIFIASADSTGHGVPGAMVSVVCSNALNRSVKEFGLKDPAAILNKTRELVLETFAKGDEEIKDGMDISLLCIDKHKKIIQWSGANNSLLFKNPDLSELTEIKADKQSISKMDNPLPFTSHQIDYRSGTLFYLMTDGLADQFGGPKGKKIMRKNLSEFLYSISELTMSEQKIKLELLFESWRGDLEQVDDISVVGIRIV